MKKLPAALALSLFLAPAVYAGDENYSRDYKTCMDKCDGSTASTVGCIDAELKKQDALLNTYYKKAMQGLSTKGQEKLREAQRAWIKMRDADVLAIYDHHEGGTIAQIVSAAHQLSLTAERVRFLKNTILEEE